MVTRGLQIESLVTDHLWSHLCVQKFTKNNSGQHMYPTQIGCRVIVALTPTTRQSNEEFHVAVKGNPSMREYLPPYFVLELPHYASCAISRHWNRK